MGERRKRIRGALRRLAGRTSKPEARRPERPKPPPPAPPDPVEIAIAYHLDTRHHGPHRYAREPGFMDWDTQPDPFRRYEGAPQIPLPLAPVPGSDEEASGEGAEPLYERLTFAGAIPPAPVDQASVARLLQDSLGLSAWKEFGEARWSLRVNPSSGNLHPAEGYLVLGPEAGLWPQAAVFHYEPHEHALSLRAELSPAEWAALSGELPPGALLVALTSIHWRESWKYGERAFRYCHMDAGHAIGAIRIAAGALGWGARLVESMSEPDLARLLRVDRQSGPEAESAAGLLVIAPGPVPRDAAPALPPALLERLAADPPPGRPNALSPEHRPWEIIDLVERATVREGPADPEPDPEIPPPPALLVGDAPILARQILHQRRSAVSMDGRTGISRDAFLQILMKAHPGDGQLPADALPWRPRVHLALYVHRVAGLAPGLYMSLRDPAARGALQGATDPEFAWAAVAGAPEGLGLYLLREGDVRYEAASTSCGQAIASDGVFAAAMIAEFAPSLWERGAWFYRRLHWECGLIGQILYLEAEASGIRGTGIGCFFDDPSARVLGLRGDDWRALYHFTVGGPVEDTRLRTAPPYGHLSRDDRGEGA